MSFSFISIINRIGVTTASYVTVIFETAKTGGIPFGLFIG
jgi:hypothetical protein